MRSTGSRPSRTGARLLVAASALLLAQCALRAPGPERFAFALTGDAPYNEREEPHFTAMLDAMNAEPLAFVVHVGDFKAGSNAPCTDALYLDRKARFDRSAHPFVLTPGDNDWTDCRRPTNGRGDPIERLARLREIFFADALSLGARRIATETQGQCLAGAPGDCRCGPFPENRLWEHHGVVFATINVQASNNNRGFDAANDREADCRDSANLRWLEHAGERARTARALVVFTQADLWAGKTATYAPYTRALVALAQSLAKPVLFAHGDTHVYRADAPFVDAAGNPVSNPLRVETYGSPMVGWVKVSVDPALPEVFSFEPKLVAVVP